jgi:pimeloyl-ACP methyl ester carboxylesterase
MGTAELGFTRRGQGPPLVLLNGFAATRQDWDPTFLAALERRHELILIDHRGLGGSCDRGPFTIEELATDVANQIEVLALERPAVLGWSMGGFVALSLAVAAPQQVGGLVLLATSSGGSPTTLGRSEIQTQLRDFSGTPREQATRLISLLFAPERARQIDADFGEMVATSRAAFPVEIAQQQWRAIETWSENGIARRLGGIRCPVLIATGSDDLVIPPENSLALAQAIPGSWLARFPHCGHGFTADYPEALAGLIEILLSAG